MYSICLTVTANCGSTSSSCNTYSVYRTSNLIINVNVTSPSLLSNPLDIVSLNEVEFKSLLVINGNYYVSYPTNEEIETVSLTDLYGKLIYNGSNTNITTGDLSKNIYILTVKTKNNKYTKKVVIE